MELDDPGEGNVMTAVAAAGRQSPFAPWRMSIHANRRAREHGFTDREIATALQRPDISYPQPDYGPNRQIRQHGRIAVVVDTARWTVITVLFRNPQEWQLHSAAGRAA